MAETEACNISPPESPYAYAQFYGLCSRRFELDSTLLPGWPISCDPVAGSDVVFNDDMRKATTQDVWHITPETNQYLQAVIKDADTQSRLCDAVEHFSWPDLRLDLPALFHDHDAHMDRLLKQHTQVVSIGEMKAACRPGQEDEQGCDDQDLMCIEMSDLRQLEKDMDKLHVSTETVAYIGQLLSLSASATLVDNMRTSSNNILCTREDTPVVRLLSSPTLHSAAVADIVSDSLIPLPSEGDDLWTKDLEREVLAMLDDAFESVHDMADLGIDGTHHNAPITGDVLNHHPTRSMHDLRLTSPLIPADDQAHAPNSQADKSEFKAMLSLIPRATAIEGDIGGRNLDEETSILLHKLAADDLEKVNRTLASERLVEIDTTLKVPLPAVTNGFMTMKSLGNRRWNEHLIDTASELITKEERRWKGISKIERGLCWTPFDASSAVFDLTDELPDQVLPSFEQYEGNALLAANLQFHISISYGLDKNCEADLLEPANMQDQKHSSSQLDQQLSTTLTQLQVQTSDVPKDKAFQPTTNIRSLLQKRKSEIEHGTKADGPAAKKRTLFERHHTTTGKTSLLDGDIIRYMSAHGQTHVGLQPSSSSERPAIDVHNLKEVRNLSVEVGQTSSFLSVPALPGSEHSKMQIVVSTHMMARRSLMGKIEKTLPNLTIIERETPEASKEQLEADLTVSATAGIVLTTMQKLRQRPLPGQTDRNSLRLKLARISGSYQSLLVLVSEGNEEAEFDSTTCLQPLSDRDCEALSELLASTSSFETKVQVQYVAGGEAELCSWICSTIGKTAVSSATYRLAREESMWERFLRTAAFNAFAAQTLLAGVKTDDTSHGSLAQLATMIRADRSALVQHLLHDSAGSTKLNSILDGTWVQQPQAMH